MSEDNHAVGRELLRRALLLVLDANGSPHGLGKQALALLIHQFGARANGDQVSAEMQYLEDKGLVTRVQKTISPENGLWRITAEGRDFLASS
jgi:hypothetical protein